MREDPIGGFNFYLMLVDSADPSDGSVASVSNYAVAGFSECAGLDAVVEVMEYKEGGVNDYVHKFRTRASFSNITLKRGIVYQNTDLWDWHNSFVVGDGTRRDGLIVLQDESHEPAMMWKFKRGIPVKWVGPTLNASQNNIAIESLEISHEGLLLEAT
jgi:phage tail-like protein